MLEGALRLQEDPRRPKPAGSVLAFADPDFGGAVSTTAVSQPAPGVSPGALEERGAAAFYLGERNGLAPLPGTREEARAIRAAFPDATVLEGAHARKDTALAEAEKYRYLHFATHGLFNDAAPLMSCLPLAQGGLKEEEDGFLTAREILEMKLSAELVVLSACETARGKERRGEGLVGLTWALFAAGSPSQVVSQWPVSDESTAKLMGSSYRQLAAGKPKGAALREAALSLMKEGEYRHPYFWAPFILVGDWR